MSTTSITEWCSTRHNPAYVPVDVLSYGDLLRPGEYRIHSRFERAANFLNGEDLISLVDPFVGAGPVNVVVRNLIWLDSDVIRIAADDLEVGDIRLRFDVSLRYDSQLEIPETVQKDRLQTGVLCFHACLRRCAPAKSMVFLLDETRRPFFESNFESFLADHFRFSIEAIRKGLLIPGVQTIKGLGFGFTPSGDDFNAGLLVAFRILQKLNLYHRRETIEEIFAAAKSDNPFTMSFLRCAYQSRVNEKTKQAIQAIFSADEKRIMESAQSLVSIGATSGADFGTGLVFGLSQIESNEH